MMTEKTKMISIKIKLLGIMLPMIILIMTVLTGLSYYVSKKAMQSNARKLLQTSVESQAAEMEAWLERNLVSVSVAKQAVEKMEFDETSKKRRAESAGCGWKLFKEWRFCGS